jgi:hypothetical protein
MHKKGAAGNIMPCPVEHDLLKVYKDSITTLDSLVPDPAEWRSGEI